MPNYKAIPTKYNGVEYRSRLEARWAMFFDYLGIEYCYEYEGFQLPSGWYVPDFYLPEHGWFEIKPLKPNEREWKLANELSQHLKEKSDAYLDNSLNIVASKYLDVKSQVYMLIGFPLEGIYDTTTEESEYKNIKIYSGNFWLEDSKQRIGFSRNSYWNMYVNDKVFENLLLITNGDKACFACYKKTLLCKQYDSLISEHLDMIYKTSHSVESWKYEALLEKIPNIPTNFKKSLSEANDKLFDSIFQAVIDFNRTLQVQCPYRNSKRINDAYQMASKHRFH